MARLLALSKVKIEKELANNKIKVSPFEGFPDSIRMGVHGGVAEFFKLTPDQPVPSTLDYNVAAIGGCMTGTVAGALEARGIRVDPEKLQVEAEGRIEEVDGKMILTKISLRYKLKIPKEKTRECRESPEASRVILRRIRKHRPWNWSGMGDRGRRGARKRTWFLNHGR